MAAWFMWCLRELGLWRFQNCMPVHSVALVKFCRGGDEISAFTVEREGPGTVSGMAPLSSISGPCCSDYRQKMLYEDVGMEEQVCPLVQGIQGSASQLTQQITP